MKIEKLGWVVAAALGAVMIGSGFQGRSDKVGVVDLGKVYSESDFAKRQNDQLRAYGDSRMALLEFLDANRAMAPDTATRFRDLSLKANSTAPEKQELEKIKADAVASSRRLRELQTKQTNEAEGQQLQELTRRTQMIQQVAQRWASEFDQDVRQMQDQMRTETLQRARTSVRESAARQGYTLVFVNEIAPYGANDLTAEALKAMNARR
jgi:Skp family chaperone for outer membrane proteins